jgi:transcriptional regulator with XRE-family HTH domain
MVDTGGTLRRLRRGRVWTQDHLALVSGVSTRTIQRVEAGHPAVPDTLFALASALGVDAHRLVVPDPSGGAGLLRCTPLLISEEIGDELDAYRHMGFSVIETGDPACVGLRAGETYKILATRAHIAGIFGAATAEALVGRTVDYLHVSDLDAFCARAGWTGRDIVATAYGTREVVVATPGGPMIVAERRAAVAPDHPSDRHRA